MITEISKTAQEDSDTWLVTLWRRFPVVLRAVIGGLLLAAAGTIPWSILVTTNAKHWPEVPWAVPSAAFYLWIFWMFANGHGWPRATMETRRILCRANSLSRDVLVMAMIAGILGLTGVVLLQRVMARLVELPPQQHTEVSHFPFMSLLLWIVMGAVVAGIVEEVSFRGYLQGPIERRHGPVIAILVTGSLFGLAHLTHPEVGLILMPYYLAVATVYGALACLTNSIFPSIVLHGGGNILGAIALFGGGLSEWQAMPKPKRLVWQSGADTSFWIAVIEFLIVSGVAVGAYAALARIVRGQQPREIIRCS